MKIPRTFSGFLAALILIIHVSPLSAQVSRCRPSDATARNLVKALKKIATETDTLSRSIWAIPETVEDSVVAVTDSATCAIIGDIYNDDLPIAARVANRQVYVVRIRDVYIVFDPTARGITKWDVIKTVKSDGSVLARIAG